MIINFGEPLQMDEVMEHRTDGKVLLAFNEQLEEQLRKLVYQIDASDKVRQWEIIGAPQPVWKKFLLALPAAIGFVFHAPLYFPAKTINQHYFDNDHFDSTLFSILALAYPLYVLMIGGIAGWLFGWLISLIAMTLLPLTAWALIQLKPQR